MCLPNHGLVAPGLPNVAERRVLQRLFESDVATRQVVLAAPDFLPEEDLDAVAPDAAEAELVQGDQSQVARRTGDTRC